MEEGSSHPTSIPLYGVSEPMGYRDMAAPREVDVFRSPGG